jgi:hypothetical protein
MRPFHILLLAILPILSGCGMVQSRQPLSSPSAAVPDKRLAGLWQTDIGKDGHCYYYFAIGARGNGTVMIFGADPKTGFGQMKYDFFVTPARKEGYMNLSHLVTSGTDSGFFKPDGDNYFFVKYRINWLGQLEYWPVMGDVFGRAVTNHKLRGKADYDKQHDSYGNIYLTDSGQHILDFINSSKPKDVLGYETKLTWVGGP